ncbi:MAG: hypothetical protein Ta2A_24500 [Treponemataceae bacterium]|nr:MAG: hypothetical protein Ta2A_24500 [Treponemataceae bacterium]
MQHDGVCVNGASMRPQFCFAKLRLVVAARPCAAGGKCWRVVAAQREVPGCTLCCARVQFSAHGCAAYMRRDAPSVTVSMLLVKCMENESSLAKGELYPLGPAESVPSPERVPS